MTVTCRGVTGELVRLEREHNPTVSSCNSSKKSVYLYQIDLYDAKIGITYSIDWVSEEEMVFQF